MELDDWERVKCAECGRGYTDPRPVLESGWLAPVLWVMTDDGRWWCGATELCRPAVPEGNPYDDVEQLDHDVSLALTSLLGDFTSRGAEWGLLVASVKRLARAL